MWQPPAGYVLNIVSTSSIIQWNGDVSRAVFKSQNNGIVAARQATDGSRFFAIADGRCVIIQDLDQDVMRRKHTLAEFAGRIQLLRFASETEELYFTTSLQNMVRCYGVHSNTMRKPLCELPRPPTVMAVSKQHLVTACNNPVTVVLRALSSEGKTTTVAPLASSACITLTAIHPQRLDLFLVAFADGSLSVHSARQIYRRASSNGQVGYVESLTRPDGTNTGGIFAAQFMHGVSLRIIILDHDRSCRVVSFYNGLATISRIWSMPMSATSFAVLSPVDAQQEGIAIGTPHGEVAVFDLNGTLVHHFHADASGSPIVDLEWTVSIDLDGRNTENKPPRGERKELQMDSEASEGTVLMHEPGAIDNSQVLYPQSPASKGSAFDNVKTKFRSKRKPSIIVEVSGEQSPPHSPAGEASKVPERPSVARKPLPRLPDVTETNLRSVEHHWSYRSSASPCAPRDLIVKASDGTTDGDSIASTSTVSYEPVEQMPSKRQRLFQRFKPLRSSTLPPQPPLPTVEQTPSVTLEAETTARQIEPQASPEAKPHPIPNFEEISERIHPKAPIDDTANMQADAAGTSAAQSASLKPDGSTIDDSDTPSFKPAASRAQEIYQRRRLTVPQRSKLATVQERSPFVRKGSRLSSVDSAVMQELFKDFSSTNIAERTTETADGAGKASASAASQADKAQSEVATLREQMDLLAGQMTALGDLVRSRLGDGHTEQDRRLLVPGRHRGHDCCAADILHALLSNAGHGCHCILNQASHCSGPHASIVGQSDRRLPTQAYGKSMQQQQPARNRRQLRSDTSETTSAERSYRSGHRRQYHSRSKPGWIRVGKFQVRRVSAGSVESRERRPRLERRLAPEYGR